MKKNLCFFISLFIPMFIFIGCSSGGGGSIFHPAVQYDIEIAPTENGILIPEITKAAQGTTVNIVVRPNTGYGLSSLKYTAGEDELNLLDENYYNSETQRISFTMPGNNVVIEGEFGLNVLKIKLIYDSDEGTVTTNPENTATFETPIEVNVVPKPGYRIAKTDDAVTITSYTVDENNNRAATTENLGGLDGGQYGFDMPGSDVEINVQFERIYNVNVRNNSNNTASKGTIYLLGDDLAVASQFAAGENVRIGVSWPDPELDDLWDLWVIDTISGRITGNGGSTIDITNRSFIMPDGAVTLTVTYKLNPNYLHQISVDEKIQNGTIAPKAAVTGTASLLQATSTVDTVFLDIQPLPGYQLKAGSLKYNPGGVPITVPISGARPSFLMPTDDVTVTGEFEKKDLNVTASALTGGTIRFSNNQSKTTAKLEDAVAFTVTANSGYRIKPNSVKYSYNDGKSRTTTLTDPATLGDPYSFPMPAYDVTVTAAFDPLYTVSVSNDTTIGTVSITNASKTAANSFIAGERVNVGVTVKDPLYLLGSIAASNTYANGANANITDAGFFNMPAGAATVTVTYILNPDNVYKINVTGTANGTITAMSTSTGNSPITESKANLPAKPAIVYLDLQPDPGYTPTSLKYNDGTDHPFTPIPTSGRASFPMPSKAVTVSGTFGLKDLNIAKTTVSGGTIILGKTTAKMGDNVTFTVTVNSGYRLRTGSVMYTSNGINSAPSLSGTTYSFPMPAYDVTVSAQFDQLYAVSVTTDTAKGTVSITNAGGTVTNSFIAGEKVNVGVTVKDPLYLLDAISASNTYDNGANANITSAGFFNMPAGVATVTVTYKLNPDNLYKINVAGTANGTITAMSSSTGNNPITESKANNTTVYLDLQPDPGYTTASLTYNNGTSNIGITIPTSGRASFTMPSKAVTVSGTFGLKDLNIAKTTVSGGTITLGKTTAKMGDNVTFSVTADANSRLRAGSVKYSYNGTDSIPSLTGATYSFPMPAYDVTVTAAFDPLYTVSVSNDDGIGKVLITNTSGAETNKFIAGEGVNVGVNVTDEQYIIGSIVGTNTSNSSPVVISGGRFTMPAGNVTVTVTYAENTEYLYSVSVGPLSNGSIQLYDAQTGGNIISSAKVNTTVYLDLQPDPGYAPVSLKYNNAGSDYPMMQIPASGRVSFTMPKGAVTVSGTFGLKDLNVAKTPVNGGTITLGKTTAKMGDNVTFTVTADANYRLRAGSVKYSYNGIDSVPSLTGTNYSFPMPAYDVTVTAVFDTLYAVSVTNDDPSVGTVSVTNTNGTPTDKFISGERVNVSVNITNNLYLYTVTVGNIDNGNITNTGFFNMPSTNVTVTVTYKLNPDNLYKVNVAGTANGTITAMSTPTGNTPITESKNNAMVYLDLQPDPGFTTTSLTYNDGNSDNNITPIPTSGRASFTMPAKAVTVSGTFGLKEFNINAATVTGGSISLGKAKAQMGDNVTFTVTANDGFRLRAGSVKYTYNGSDSIPALSGPTYSFPMPAYDTTVSAQFDSIGTVNVTKDQKGTVLITNTSGTETNSFIAGERVNVSVNVIDPLYIVNKITGDNGVGDITGGYFTMVPGGTTITVTYMVNPNYLYQITVNYSADGNIDLYNAAIGGSLISKAKAADWVYLDIQPTPGYVLTSLTYDDGSVHNMSIPLSGRASFQMPAHSVTISGVYALKGLSVTGFSNPVQGGIITPSKTETAQIGDSITVTVKVNANYRLNTGTVKYSYNGNDYDPVLSSISGSTYTYKFTMPGYDVTVSADFDRVYTVTKKITPDDTAGVLNISNASGQAASFAWGETVNVNAAAKTGYQLSSISVDGTVITTGSFVMPASDVTVTAAFTAPLYTIDTGSVTGNGFISAASEKGGAYQAIEGETVTLTIQNGAGYTLDTLTVKNGSQNWPCTLSPDNLSATFTMPAHSVQVTAAFIRRAYTIQFDYPAPVYGSAAVVSPTGTVYYNDTVQIGVTISQTPVNGFKASLVYYLQGQSAQAVSIPQIGTTFQFKVPDFTTAGTVIIVQVKIEGAIFNLSYDPAMAGKFTFLTQFSNLPYDRYMSQVGARLVPNMGYCFASSGSSFYINNMKQLISPTIVDGSQVFYFAMPASDVVVKADLNYCTYKFVSSIEGVLDSSRAGSISVPSTAKYMDSINITAKINTGYTLQQIEFRDPVSNLVTKTITCNNAAAGTRTYSVTLNQFNTNFNSVDGGQINIVGIFNAINYTLNRMTNPPDMESISFGPYGNVPFDTPIMLTLRRTPTTRYKQGSFKLLRNYSITDKVDPEYITRDEYNATFKFYMPAYNAALYYEVEPIPSTNIVFNDPNMDANIHFYADVSDGTPEGTIYKEISSASPEQIVRLEVYKGDSPGGDNDIPIDVKYWMLNDKSLAPLSAEDVMAVKIPAGSSGRTLGIMLEIGGVPHFRSIPIN